jgi:FAD/FMN-containing dehydrogenase
MDAIAEHRARSAALLTAFRSASTPGNAVGLQKTTSNLFRRREKKARRRLDVRPFDHVVRIDAETMTADVEGMITYGALVDETLRHSLLPAVVPQLKTITVGGAVSGLGIESSSFRYGLVHESVEEMDILTGAECIVTCSRCENPDLFFGFPNSYGTLGYALRLKIRLVAAKPYVRVEHTRFTEPREFFDDLATGCRDKGIDFLDGVIFGNDEMYVTRGFFSQDAPRVSDYTYMNIYYRSLQSQRQDWLTSKGYIWRWDTDWFWCSKHFGMQNPAIRFLAKPALNSRTYQRLMRFSQSIWPETAGSESVIQDVQVPIENAPDFFDFLLSQIGITPIWVCPFRTSDRNFDLCGLETNQLYVNFGFWDVIPSAYGRGHYNKKIETIVAELGGTKGLYSTSCYDRETFWSLYDQARYGELKNRYDPKGAFPDLYVKCVERG